MVKTPARQSAMPVTLAMPEELLSFTSSILASKHFIPGIYTWLVTAEYIVRVPYIIYRHWSLDSCLSILLLLITRGYDGVSMLILIKCIRKKIINPINFHNNQKLLAFNLVDSNHYRNNSHCIYSVLWKLPTSIIIK
jgi:hypothetical protein